MQDNVPYVVDIENSGDPWTGSLLCVGYAPCDDRPMSIGDDQDQWLRELLCQPDIPIVTHTTHDLRWLKLAGWDIQTTQLIDLKAGFWLLNENMSFKLEDLARDYLGLVMDKRIHVTKKSVRFKCDDGVEVPLNEAPRDQLEAYCLRDVDAERQLYFRLVSDLREWGWYDFWMTEVMPLTQTILQMETTGVPIDITKLTDLTDEVHKKHKALQGKLLEEGKLPEQFNVDSDQQVGKFLFSKTFELKARIPKSSTDHTDFIPDEKPGRLWTKGHYEIEGMGLSPVAFTKHRQPKVDSKVLKVNYSQYPWVQNLLEYRKYGTALSVYLDPMPGRLHDGRVFGRFTQGGTVTGRLSSKEPNLQNIWARGELGDGIRGLFVGDFLIGDYSQLEPRIAAHMSKDPVLLDIFRNGRDLYIETASKILGRPISKADPERDMVKVYVLALYYGAQGETLSQVLTVNGFPTTPSEADAWLKELERVFQGYFVWKRHVEDFAHREGYIQTISGRLRRLYGTINSQEWKTRMHGERQAVDSIMQGSAADIMNGLMVGFRHPNLRLLIQVHDEGVWEYEHVPWDMLKDQPSMLQIEHDKRMLKDVAEHGVWVLDVPLVFEVGYARSWADKGREVDPFAEAEEISGDLGAPDQAI
jgi:DNA polymerase I